MTRPSSIPFTPLDLAASYLGTKETKGEAHNPVIVAWLKQQAGWANADEVPWCSAFVGEVAKRLGLQETNSLRARSWLRVGTPIATLADAIPGFDIVVLTRGGAPRDPHIIDAPGHVAFYAAHNGTHVALLGGNQGDSVKVSRYNAADVIGIRRLSKQTPDGWNPTWNDPIVEKMRA